jgi:hypothetical protein
LTLSITNFEEDIGFIRADIIIWDRRSGILQPEADWLPGSIPSNKTTSMFLIFKKAAAAPPK